MVRPSTFHAPGLDHQTDTEIRRILLRWAKGIVPADSPKEAKSKKRK